MIDGEDHALRFEAGRRNQLHALSAPDVFTDGDSPDADARSFLAFDPMSRSDVLRRHLRSAEQALDCLPCAVLIVDADARIALTNRAAQQLLTDADGLYRSGQRLAARVNGDGAMLRAAIERAANGGGQASMLKVRRRTDRLPLAAVVLPAGEADEEPRQALVLAVDPTRQASAPPALLREAFGLTEREVHVALAMVRHGSLRAAAAELGVALSTARSHLQSVFDKTGARTQIALTQLLAALSVLPHPHRPDPVRAKAARCE